MASQSKIIPGQYLVTLRHYATQELRAAHFSTLSTMTEDQSTPFNVQVQQEFELDSFKGYSATCDEQTRNELENMANVVAIEPIQVYSHCATQANAPWGLARICSTKTVQETGPFAYNYRDDAAGQGTYVYVVDTGINETHTDFEGRAKKGPKFVTPNAGEQPSSDNDIEGHGTHCAGTIAGKTYGVAKKANVVGVKVFNDTTGGARTDDIIKALEWVVGDAAAHPGKNVVNMSLGGGPSPALDTAVANAVRAGVVVCVAAGNDPIAAERGSPAREPLAITVGAIESKDWIAPFSSFGKMVDIFAPGVGIQSTWIGSTTATNSISGTSMATPHVAGAAALLLSDSAWKGAEPREVPAKLIILANKNQVRGLEGPKERTANVLLRISSTAADQ